MFRKIVSNLSFSPSAGSQLTYYLRRLQKEGLTRKLSLVFAAGLVVVQIANIVSPASAAHVPSPNDIIYGGLTGDVKADLLSIYDQNHDNNGHTGYQALFSYFGITRANIASAHVATLNSSDHSLMSLGRNHRFADDQVVTVAGQTYYLRHLFEWGDHVSYQMVTGSRSDGSMFAVMVDCGNIVVRSIPVKPPKLQLLKSMLPGYPGPNAQVAPGTTLGYRVYMNNNGEGSAHLATIEDPIPAHTTFIWQGSGAANFYGMNSANYPGHNNVKHAYWIWGQVAGGAKAYYVDMTVKIDSNAADGTQICNVASVRSNEQGIANGNKMCVTVVKKAPPPPPPPPTPTSPNLSQAKAVANLTQHITNANKTMAAAGDILQYTLTTKNSGDGAAKGYIVTEDINDILAYADVTQLGGAKLTSGILSWSKSDIAAGKALVKTFQVKVKSPIPATPSTPGDTKLFDLKLDNIYGNAVEVTLPAPTPKAIETTVEKLPQTGGSTPSTVTFIFIAMMVFFYFRNRQLVKELKMLRVDNVTG